MNYIADAPNPFNLAAPPRAFLAQMFAYDEKLVIFPSSTDPVYRLCRRSIGPPTPLLGMKGNPDAAICRRHRLAPVKAILPAPIGHFGPHILQDLSTYDTTKIGGGAAAADRLDQLDAMEAQQIDRDIEDEGYARGREAYRVIKGLTGQTVYSGIKKPEGPGSYGAFMKAGAPKRTKSGRAIRPTRAGAESTAGAVFVGRGLGDGKKPPTVTLT